METFLKMKIEVIKVMKIMKKNYMGIMKKIWWKLVGCSNDVRTMHIVHRTWLVYNEIAYWSGMNMLKV